MVNSSKTLSKKINRYLERHSETKVDFSKRAKISRSQLDSYLDKDNPTPPTLDTLDRIAAAMEMKPWELLTPSDAVPLTIEKYTADIKTHMEYAEKLQVQLKEVLELQSFEKSPRKSSTEFDHLPDDIKDLLVYAKSKTDLDTIRQVLNAAKRRDKDKRWGT